MKTIDTSQDELEMLPEYDFSGLKGDRGKYYEAYRKGHQVRVYEESGEVTVHYFTLEDGAVMLEEDVRSYFPTSESVNNALRMLIAIASTTKQHKKSA